MPVELTGECARVYKDLKASLISMLESGEIITVANKVALFTKFRQIVGGTLAGMGVLDANNAKIQALKDELSDHSEQAIIWSCFTEEINLLVMALGKDWSVVRFDGQTGEKDRDSAIEDFRSGKARLFIANPAAASQGLNLQNAHLQYWYSLPTQAKHYEQGEGRIHRSGQTETCVYKQIICEGTVDERISKLMKDKTDIMSSFRDGNIADVLELI
jgi:SNF2 family DNA or RNA helicase